MINEPEGQSEKEKSSHEGTEGQISFMRTNETGDTTSPKPKLQNNQNYSENVVEKFNREFWTLVIRKLHRSKVSDNVLAATSVALTIIGLSQLAIAWENYKEATPLTGYARDNTAAAVKFAQSAEKISTGMTNAVIQLGNQVGELDTGAQQTGRLASAAEKANNNAAQSDRPWFGANFSMENFDVGKKPIVTVIFVNTGKRPARVTLSATQSNYFYKFPEDPPYSYDTTPSSSIVVPNGTLVSKFNVSKVELSQPEITAAESGNPTYYIYAKIQFVDILERKDHWAHFCWKYIGNVPNVAKGFYGCPEYNDTDK